MNQICLAIFMLINSLILGKNIWNINLRTNNLHI
jgi:hypothetical protein